MIYTSCSAVGIFVCGFTEVGFAKLNFMLNIEVCRQYAVVVNRINRLENSL